MNEKKKKTIRKILIIFITILAVLAGGILFVLTHTQIIVGAIQKLSASTVNTVNLYEPLGEPMEGLKDNGQYVITEVKYSENYPNSYLDITYPSKDRDASNPTLIYFHGGGFFGGSKSVGDPLAESDATALLDDICAEGFNLVNIDYVLVPEYHFPDPLAQANEAFFLNREEVNRYNNILWEDRLYLLQLRNRKIVFSHESALYMHNLSDREPFSPVITVGRGYNAKHLKDNGVVVHTVRSEWLELGLTHAQTFTGNTVRIYDRERCICDIIKNKNKMDIQVFQMALTSYFTDGDKNIHNLMKYSEIMGISDKVRQYTEVLL